MPTVSFVFFPPKIYNHIFFFRVFNTDTQLMSRDLFGGTWILNKILINERLLMNKSHYQ
uniref:Uncharacterized protein n=1 Tax=Anguilla anguilla TaxID=7936 RepID=A0A0E9XT34_ANGAN